MEFLVIVVDGAMVIEEQDDGNHEVDMIWSGGSNDGYNKGGILAVVTRMTLKIIVDKSRQIMDPWEGSFYSRCLSLWRWLCIW